MINLVIYYLLIYFRKENCLPELGQLPNIVNSQGITHERAEYLYKEIREFCREGTEDLVAPRVSPKNIELDNFVQ